jgi:CcmD family protein
MNQGNPSDFEPVTGAVAETVQAAPLVVVAYGLIWVAVLFYLWTIHRRQVRLQADIRELANRLRDAPGP